MKHVLLIAAALQLAAACDRGAPSAEEGATPEAVCARLDELRAKDDPASETDGTCAERMPVAQKLDGPALWKLRSGCILAAETLDQALRCNRANHPDWPEPGSTGR